MNTLGERIKLARGSASQDTFAKAIQISKGSLGFYERNENLPNVDVVTKICSTTGVSIEWLITGQGPMRRGQAAEHEPNAPQVSPETTGMLGGMQDRLAFIEAGVAANRLVLSTGHAPSATCAGCATLQDRLDKTNERLEILGERLYQSAERERESAERERTLLKENGELREELALLKNKLLASNTAAEPLSNVS